MSRTRRFTFTRLQRAAILLSSLLGGVLSGILAAPPASAGYATNVGYLKIGNDYIVNHDFYGKSYVDTNVDWQMSWIFWGTASRDKIENYLLTDRYWQDATAQFGNKQGYLNNNGSGWVWQGSDGKATSRPFCGTDRYHYRNYAPGGVNFYDPTSANWGYWVMASSHRDVNDGCNGWSGNSEDAEYDMYKTIAGLICGPNDWHQNCGYTNRMVRNYLNTGSAHNGYDRDAGSSHRWQTNGYATTFQFS